MSAPHAPRVVVTAAVTSLVGLEEALSTLGVFARRRALVSFAPPEDWSPLDAALQRLHEFAALAFTSPRAARAVIERRETLSAAGQAVLPLGARPVWAAGAATAQELERTVSPVLVPASRRDAGTEDAGAAAELAEAMIAARVGSPVLFPSGTLRRDTLPRALDAAGLRVHEVSCYRSVLAGAAAARAAADEADILVVASPSVAELLAALALPRRPALVAIGPTTAAAASGADWEPAAISARPTPASVLEAVRSLLSPDAGIPS